MAGRKSHEGESWPYHETHDGNMAPCASNPCRLHGGGDIDASSLEEAYRIRDSIRSTASMALRFVEDYDCSPYDQLNGFSALKQLKSMVADRHGKPLPIPAFDSSGHALDAPPLPVIGIIGGDRGGMPVYEVSPDYAREYAKMLGDTAVLGGDGAQVPVKSEQELRSMRMFVSPDGMAGAALEADKATGEGNPPDRITAVCKRSLSSWKHPGTEAVRAAAVSGGRRLACYDTFLPALFRKVGFRPVARTAFSEADAPRTWSYRDMDKYNHGRPDMVYMISLSDEAVAGYDREDEIDSKWDDNVKRFPTPDEANRHAETMIRTESKWADSMFRNPYEDDDDEEDEWELPPSDDELPWSVY